MAYLVTIQTDPSDPSVLYLGTDPSMSAVMGGFGPARYMRNGPVKGASYVIAADDLPRFTVYCANRSVRVVDKREAEARPEARTRPPWAERPLPECSHCGQPVARGVSPSFCPNCGATWDAVEVMPSTTRHVEPGRVCLSCGASTPAAFAHCTSCGSDA